MIFIKVTIHNFRSVVHADFELEKYSLLVGENNSGKTNILNALRVFYEEEKFIYKNDFPKCHTEDKESWIELEFLTTADEQKSLRDEYKSKDNILKVRKYLNSEQDTDLIKTNQSNIYAYESGKLSKNLFYGAKNISQAKLGRILFIPEVSKTDEHFKLTGPSPLRDMINFVMKKVVKSSPVYESLQEAFNKFNSDFHEESSKDGFSLNELASDINKHIKEWDINFGLDINPISPDQIIKNLVGHYFEDRQLNNERLPLSYYGQGLQRHLIYTLMRVNAKYVDKKTPTKKEFSPDLTIILFEEPEAFLHPAQQELLNSGIRVISEDPNQQVVVTTHSPIFVNKNILNLSALLKIIRIDGRTNIFQINRKELDDLFNENYSMFKMFTDKLADDQVKDTIKKKIRDKRLGEENIDPNNKLEEESLKYFLCMDGERSSCFFAKHVVICEGASEKIFFDHLLDNEWSDLRNNHIYFVNAMGKFNLHRYMNLFKELGIYHSVILDRDNDRGIHNLVNNFIESNKNEYTKGIYCFDCDLEKFLGISSSCRKDLKPLNIIKNYSEGSISCDKIKELKEKIINII